jgi:quercetin dioxygenase-like cupin family protein
MAPADVMETRALLPLLLLGCTRPHAPETPVREGASADPPTVGTTVLRRAEVMRRRPDTERANVRVWTMRQTPHSRTNLVEMRGDLSYHQHPDAEHTLVVLEGRVCAWHGREAVVLEAGDYISIPAGVPHKYRTLSPTALLLSFDAPAYDPNKTIAVPQEGVDFAPCPA